MKFSLTHEATITRADFVRILPAATGENDFKCVDDCYVGNRWSLRLTPLPPLKIGIVEMERYRVEIEFDAMSPTEQDSFMRRFSMHYQRGGG